MQTEKEIGGKKGETLAKRCPWQDQLVDIKLNLKY